MIDGRAVVGEQLERLEALRARGIEGDDEGEDAGSLCLVGWAADSALRAQHLARREAEARWWGAWAVVSRALVRNEAGAVCASEGPVAYLHPVTGERMTPEAFEARTAEIGEAAAAEALALGAEVGEAEFLARIEGVSRATFRRLKVMEG